MKAVSDALKFLALAVVCLAVLAAEWCREMWLFSTLRAADQQASWYGEGYRGKAMANGQFAPGFELDMARKDVRLMIESAGARPLAVLPAIAARMDALIAQGHGQDDLAILGRDALNSDTTSWR